MVWLIYTWPLNSMAKLFLYMLGTRVYIYVGHKGHMCAFTVNTHMYVFTFLDVHVYLSMLHMYVCVCVYDRCMHACVITLSGLPEIPAESGSRALEYDLLACLLRGEGGSKDVDSAGVQLRPSARGALEISLTAKLAPSQGRGWPFASPCSQAHSAGSLQRAEPGLGSPFSEGSSAGKTEAGSRYLLALGALGVAVPPRKGTWWVC